MIAELGHMALVGALFVALVQGVLPLVQAGRDAALAAGVARGAALAQAVLITGAFAALMHAFYVSDFSVYAVFAHSHSAKPLLYKLSGVWGNHEGSMVLWVGILALFGGLLALFARRVPPELMSRTLAVQGLIGAGFLAFILLTSNPFIRLDPAPWEGQGLNPLLQDPGLAFHPPMLYLGYVGFSVTFAFAAAGLLQGRLDGAWARHVRPWALIAWVCLTLGIGLGSWWAYYELGWGGWWFWDPVENASFIPWLTGTALLHSVIVTEKRNALRAWTVFLALLTFSLSLLGTFLVRSGVLNSVHAFASDPERGVFILLLLLASIGGALVLFAVRAPSLAGGRLFAPVSREGALVVNNLLLSVGAVTVLLGTLFPLIAEALDLGKLTVGPPWFNKMFLPMMGVMVLLMAAGPIIPWRRGRIGAVLGRMIPAGVLAGLVLVGTFLWADGGTRAVLTAVGAGLATWLAAGTVTAWLRRVAAQGGSGWWRKLRALPVGVHAMAISHLGVAVLITGITGSGLWTVERILTMQAGESTALGSYTVRFDGAAPVAGPNYASVMGSFALIDDSGRELATLTPERRTYLEPPQTTTEAAIYTTFISDIYAVIGESGADHTYVVRLYIKPFVPWLWYGILIIAFGGLVALLGSRASAAGEAAETASTNTKPTDAKPVEAAP